jgi:hypothetical protein
MWRWFKALEGWQRASVISVIFAIDALAIEGLALWVTDLKEAAGGSYPPIWLQVPVGYLMTLWIWAMAAVVRDWLEQSQGGRGRLYRQLRYWVFFLGAAEMALITLPRSLTFILTLPGTAIRGFRTRSTHAHDATSGAPAGQEAHTLDLGRSPIARTREATRTAEQRPQVYLPRQGRIGQPVSDDGQFLAIEDEEPPDAPPRIWTPRR